MEKYQYRNLESEYLESEYPQAMILAGLPPLDFQVLEEEVGGRCESPPKLPGHVHMTLRARLCLKNTREAERLLSRHHHRKHEDHPPHPARRVSLLPPSAKPHSTHPLTPGQPDTRAHNSHAPAAHTPSALTSHRHTCRHTWLHTCVLSKQPCGGNSPARLSSTTIC